MRRLVLFALTFTISLLLLLTACGATLSPASLTSADAAHSQMAPWQIEISADFLTDKRAADYLAQENLLESEEIQRDLSWCDMAAARSPQNERLLDILHERLQIWMLMRSNMLVLHTQEHGDSRFCLVYTAGIDAARGFYLVQYTTGENEAIVIRDVFSGSLPISSGFYPNTASLEGNTIIYGLTTAERYDIESDQRIPFRCASIEVEYGDGQAVSQDIGNPGPVLCVLPPDIDSTLVACRTLGPGGETIEAFDLTSTE